MESVVALMARSWPGGVGLAKSGHRTVTKNWLFVGSEDAGAYAATNFSIFESCRMAKVDARAYLRHAIACLHASGVDPAELTPLALAKRFLIKKQ